MMTESEFLALAPRERDALVAEAFEPKPRLVPEMDPFDDYIWSEGGLWRCEFDEVRVYADTAPLATCLAA